MPSNKHFSKEDDELIHRLPKNEQEFAFMLYVNDLLFITPNPEAELPRGATHILLVSKNGSVKLKRKRFS